MPEYADAYPRGIGHLAGDVPALRAWARASDIDKSAFAYRDGMIFLGASADGALLGLDDNRHCLTVAGSRAGKGVSVIVPNLCLYPGSALVIDPKGENAALTAARRGAGSPYCEGLGQAVHILDPFDTVPQHPKASFNPLSVFDLEQAENYDLAIDDAALIADALVTPGGDRDSHWDESARSVLEMLILHVLTTQPPESCTLPRVRQLLMSGDFLERMQENQAFDGLIAGAAGALLVMGKEERGSILSTARRNTKFLESPAMQRVLEGNDFDLGDLKRRPMTLYLCLPASRLHTHARWLRLIIGLALALMEREPARPALPVLFLMDEFAALGKMEVIETAAGLMAGYGVKLWPILQDLTQLKRHYRESWETFLGNAGLHQFFGNTDLTTLEHISKRLGKTHVLSVTENENERAGQGGQGVSTKADTAPLLNPDEVEYFFARERQKQMVLIPGQMPWALQRLSYEDPFFHGKRDWSDRLGRPAPPKPRGWGLFGPR